VDRKASSQSFGMRPGEMTLVEALQRAFAAHQARHLEEAERMYSRIIRAEPRCFDALHLLGVLKAERGLQGEAERLIRKALAINPRSVEALNNRANVLQALRQYDEALASCEKALEIRPDYVEALNNRGLVLQDLRRWDEALAAYERALALRPGDAETRWNMALLHLTRGDFERGWELFEARWATPAMAHLARDFPQPLWLGATGIAGKTILVHAEQGLGDTLQFARYVPFVEDLGASVVLESPAALERLLASSFPKARVLRKGVVLPAFDVHCPLASLPLALARGVKGIPARFPYIAVEPALARAWAERLGARTRPRVGIAWSGNPKNKIDAGRSIAFERIAPLIDARIEAHALQKEIRPGDRVAVDRSGIRLWCDELGDFADTAALVESLDLVITVDAAVAHVAGALGKPTWALLAWQTDYRWPVERETSPWYPHVRIFRQRRPGDWDPVLADARDALAAFARGEPAFR
jgi:Flp pilus assembly protein TadD